MYPTYSAYLRGTSPEKKVGAKTPGKRRLVWRDVKGAGTVRYEETEGKTVFELDANYKGTLREVPEEVQEAEVYPGPGYRSGVIVNIVTGLHAEVAAVEGGGF